MRAIQVFSVVSFCFLAFVACKKQDDGTQPGAAAPNAYPPQQAYPGYPTQPGGYGQQTSPAPGYPGAVPTYPNTPPPGYGAPAPTAQPMPPAPAAPGAPAPAPGVTPAPAGSATTPMAVPGPLAFPCTSDANCGLAHCNAQYGKCAFPCKDSAADCISGSTCNAMTGFCVPGGK